MVIVIQYNTLLLANMLYCIAIYYFTALPENAGNLAKSGEFK